MSPQDLHEKGSLMVDRLLQSSDTSSLNYAASSVRVDGAGCDKSVEEQAQQQGALQLQTLARQLEYYFSKQNLSKDTYLQTLRELNDGCVPVTILANFAKVKAILTLPCDQIQSATTLVQQEEMRMHAILQAVSEYTDFLQIHSIDCSQSTIATDETPSSAITILAVGPVQDSPCEVAWTTERPENNVIILRDVPVTVTEEHVRWLLMQVGDCPPVVSVKEDVACCWFITLDTNDRSQLIRIMMQLRQMTYPETDSYVMSRLRAHAAPVDVYSTFHGNMVPEISLRKKKKKRRAKKKSKNKVASASNAVASVAVPKVEAPTLTEDHFPSLQDDKVEWLTPPGPPVDCLEDDGSERSSADPKSCKAHSDAASTATTTSSTAGSFESGTKKHIIGGYAAAVLNQAPGPKANAFSLEEAKPTAFSRETSSVQDELQSPSVVITSSSSWGGSQSFADVLRAADAAAATQQ